MADKGDLQYYDVIVIGSGNAAFSAAHAARERGATVLMVEKAPEAWAGGNSYFTAGAFRTTFESARDLEPILDSDTHSKLPQTVLPAYTKDDFISDMNRVTEGRCDNELTDTLAEDIADTMLWLHQQGLEFRLMYDRQSYLRNGKYHFWGGLAVGSVGGGVGLINQHMSAGRKSGIAILFSTTASEIHLYEDGSRHCLVCEGPDGQIRLYSSAIVIAAGGFEADAEMRAKYLGHNWDLAKVRGTPFNTGDGIRMALALGAEPYGHWTGCHAIAWDAAAPSSGSRSITNLYSKQSYPIGIVVNRDGQRFIDEGADFRNYTYAKYGAEILKQPGAVAFQLFDSKTEPLLRKDEYQAPNVSRLEAESIDELSQAIGVNTDALKSTVKSFNESISPNVFDPAIKDGKRTTGITPPKSNWAVPIDTPPYYAFPVTCGITFTFGGVRTDRDGRVLDRAMAPIPGIYAAGELVGGLFYHNYPGGSGLAAGSVFGRRAGYAAAAQISSSQQLSAQQKLGKG